jgi:EmrB/QacA subfamily drug resistance transporter
VVAAVMLGTFLAALDTSIIGTAMPTVIGQLGGISLYSWVFSAYLLTSTTTVPIYGRMADLYGRKPVFLVSAGLFLLGSMLCGAAQSMPQLVLFRAIQGLGAGGIVPVTMTILGDIFSVEERARMQGFIGAVWGSSAIAGPTVGGVIVDYVDWRWVFYINPPFGIAASLLLWWFLHERVEHREHRIDFAGAIAMTLSITSLLLALLRVGEGHGWLDLTVTGPLLLAALLLLYFVVNERRVTEPMLPLRLFGSRVIAVAFPASILIGAALFGVTSYLPLFVQGVLGGSAIDAGIVVAPSSVMWSVASVASGRMILRFGYRISVVSGVTAMVIAGALLQLVPSYQSMWLAGLAAGVFGVGMGLSTTAFVISCQNAVAWTERGIATASVMFARTIGGSIGVAVLGTILSSVMTARLSGTAALQGANALLDPRVRDTLDPATLATIRGALVDALGYVYVGVLLVAVLALVVVFLYPKGRVDDLRSASATGRSAEGAEPVLVDD